MHPLNCVTDAKVAGARRKVRTVVELSGQPSCLARGRAQLSSPFERVLSAAGPGWPGLDSLHRIELFESSLSCFVQKCTVARSRRLLAYLIPPYRP